MVQIQILENKMMKYHGGKEKLGCRGKRHALGRFIRENTNKLPVSVKVTKLHQKRSFSFAPVLVNGISKLVLLTYKKYMVLISYDDVVHWIQTLISSNRLYTYKKYHYTCS